MVRFAAAAFALAVTTLGLSAHGADEILLLDFWSPQCGPCMQMKPTVHSFIQASYPIREVDTTRDSQLSQQFHVTGIPCFVMLVDGQEVDREVGGTSSERLQAMFEKAKQVVVARRRTRQPAQEPAGGTFRFKDDPLEVGGRSVTEAPRLGNEPVHPPTRPMPPIGIRPPEPEFGASAPGNSSDFPQTLIAATVRIRVEDAGGRSFGTGTIIDSRSGEALIVTCGHLFRESKGKGPMTVELFDVSPGGLQVAEQVPGQLISYDLDRDVAFVSIKPNKPVRAAIVAPARTQIQRGDRVATIGCSNGKDPTLLPQRVNMLDRYQGPANIEVSGAPEEGRSGGGLFNLQGQLIGVCYAADYEGKEGLYTALESIHGELDRLNLREVYEKGGSPTRSGGPLANGTPDVIRGQEEPVPGIVPLNGNGTAGSAAAEPAMPKGLSKPEEAAFAEVMQRTSNSEVMVIVRPKTPGGESEVFHLKEVSPEFVNALMARKQSSQAPVGR